MDVSTYAVVFIITTLLVFWIRQRKKRFSIFSDNGIPGPKPSFWTGNIIDVVKMGENFDYENTKKYGNIFGYFIGVHPMLSVTDPDLMKLIQVKESKIFYTKASFFPDGGIPNPLGKLFLSVNNDQDWKRMRTITCPAFSSGKLRKIFPIINYTTNMFLEKVRHKSTDKEEFDISSFYKQLLTDIITRSIFGIETDVQRGKLNIFLQSLTRVFQSDASDLLSFISVCFPETEPIPSKLRELVDVVRDALGLSSAKVLIRNCKEIIEGRKRLPKKKNDLLQYMMDGKVEMKKLFSIKDEDLIAKDLSKEDEKEVKTNDEDGDVMKLTEDEIIINSIVLFTAGNETASSNLSFASYFLATNPDIQEKVREEIKTTIGNKGKIEYDDLPKLQYLEQVIEETLRLFPVTSFVTSRTSKQKFKYKGITIPKGTAVTMPLWAIHRNPDYWPDPDKFIPERFSPENKTKINIYNYQPFGNGPRNCTGMRLAQIIMRFVLARLLMSYRLQDCNEDGLRHHVAMFTVTPNKVMVKAIPLIS